jgi:hypothetical protein
LIWPASNAKFAPASNILSSKFEVGGRQDGAHRLIHRYIFCVYETLDCMKDLWRSRVAVTAKMACIMLSARFRDDVYSSISSAACHHPVRQILAAKLGELMDEIAKDCPLDRRHQSEIPRVRMINQSASNNGHRRLIMVMR